MNNSEDRIPRDIEYGPPETQEEIGQYLQALSSKHRRQILRYLQVNRHADMEDLADHLSTHTPEEEVENLRIGLVHNHLPALRAQGLLSFDSRSKEISRESIPDFVESLLAFTSETTPRESER